MKYPYRYAPNAEVIGAPAQALIYNMQRDQIMESVKAHKLDNIVPDGWYLVDSFIKLFDEWISEKPGEASANLVSVGIAVIQHMLIPPEVESLPFDHIMMAVGEMYKMQHRGGDAGTIVVTRPDAHHITYTISSVYPDDLIYGYIWGFARRYFPKNIPFTVSYDDNLPRQSEGAESTTVHLTWK